jgi:hypothetical protein
MDVLLVVGDETLPGFDTVFPASRRGPAGSNPRSVDNGC